MKIFSKILLIIFVLSSSSTFAQTYKFGHINVQDLINLMPERDSAVISLEKLATELQDQITSLQTELQTKYAVFQQKQATWTAAILEAKQNELQDINTRLEKFQQTTAPQEYQQTSQALFAPIYKKANEALAKIGKAQSFIYIFDTSAGNIPYIGTEHSVDVLPLAKAELKIPADKKTMQPKQQQPAEQQKAKK